MALQRLVGRRLKVFRQELVLYKRLFAVTVKV
jgi:hypothetical protein